MIIDTKEHKYLRHNDQWLPLTVVKLVVGENKGDLLLLGLNEDTQEYDVVIPLAKTDHPMKPWSEIAKEHFPGVADLHAKND